MTQTDTAELDPTDPSAYPHWVDDVIRFNDQDPGGHVNNAAYASYVEHGRVSLMRACHFDRLPDSRFVLAHLEIDYRAEGRFPARLRIGSRVRRVGTSSVTLGHAVFADDRCLATAVSVLVHMMGDKSAPLPDAARDALKPMR
ncbi:MAG: thioesterase family protein [Alphaproteobacteria bacterium]